MYTAEEQGAIEDVEFEEVKAKKANKKEISMSETEPSQQDRQPKPEAKALDPLKVSSMDEAKKILLNDFGMDVNALKDNAAINQAAASQGLEIVIEKANPGF